MIKIAIPSSDGTQVFDHFGRTPGFVIVESDAGKINSRQFVKNDFTGHARGEHLQEVDVHVHKSHDSIFAALPDIQVVIARGMGRRLYQDFEQRNIQVFVTQQSSIDQALDQYFRGTLDNNPDRACDH
jgi:predicted Fe-Mo cluster-binding NifX family protein